MSDSVFFKGVVLDQRYLCHSVILYDIILVLLVLGLQHTETLSVMLSLNEILLE